MQRKIFMTMVAFLAFAMNVNADNISVDDVSIVPGEQAEVTVRLHVTSQNQYAGWQMDLLLPDGVSTIPGSGNNNSLQGGQLGDGYDDTFSLNSKHRSNGEDRWLAFSASAHAISTTSGILFTFPIKADKTLTNGTKLTASVKKIIFTTPSGTEDIDFDDVTFTVNIGSKEQFEGIEINKENFPDTNFRNYLLSQTYGADGWLYKSEINGIKSMDVSNQQIANLMGIQHFSAMHKLNVSGNQLVTLDLSANVMIDTLNCDNNQLAKLDLSTLSALMALRCAGNQLMCITLAEGSNPGTYYEGENIVIIGSGASHGQYLERSVKMMSNGMYGIKVPSDFDFAHLSKFVVDGETYYRGDYSDFPITLNSDKYIVFPSTNDPSSINYTYAFPSEPSYLYPYVDNRLEVNVSVTEITDKPVSLLGDVNNDGVISISDAVCIISWLQENSLPVFIEGAADYNKDGGITVSDALAIIQMLLTLEPDPVIPDIPDDDVSHLYPTTSARGIDVELCNASPYTAFTMDVTLPEGMTVNDISLDTRRAPKHQLVFNQLSDGRYRVIGFSPTLDSFNGNDGTLLTIKTNKKGTGKIGIDNIHFVDLNAQEYSLNAAQGNTTGIDLLEAGTKVYAYGSNIVVESDGEMKMDVYTATGLLYKTLDVKAGRNVFSDNAPGIYIVGNKKINIK